MNVHQTAAYERAREFHKERGVVLSPRRPWSFRSKLLAGACVFALAGLLKPITAIASTPTEMYLGAAGAWTFYNEAKKYLMSGDIDLNSSTFRMGLYTSASNAATATLSRHDQVTNEIGDGNGYSSSGKALAAVTWTAGASASEMRFDATANLWTATGGSIANVRYAVIFIEGASAGARKLLCYSALSTAQFTVTTGNTLTITPSANGIFELN